MKYRLLFAVGFVVLVSGLIFLRDHGYLGGRELGGPLDLNAPAAARVVDRSRLATFRITGDLTVPAVRVQNVSTRFASPELGIVKSVDGRPLEGATLARLDTGSTTEVPPIGISLRAARAGLYYAIGLIVDYRNGQRRFRIRESQRLCIAVHTKQRCDSAYAGPGDALVAQVGGPSRYRGARFTETRARYAAPGSYTAHITIVNRTRSAIDVTHVGLDRNPAVRLTTAGFRLAPRAAVGVRLALAAARCPDGQEFTFDRLRADLDGGRRSIPLSLPLEFRC